MKYAGKAFQVLLFLIPLIFTIPIQAQTWGSPVWADEFNGSANSAIDPTKWTYDIGNLNVNSELEIYCAPSTTATPCDPVHPNAFIDGSGHLVVQHRLNGTTWTSARLKTQGVKTFQYGRIEASIQFPSHDGLWPAFWMLGSNIDTIGWPKSGEVDIMENWPALGPSKNETSMHGDTYFGANGLSSGYNFPNGERVDTAFHTYGIIWSPNMMQFYFDDPANITFVRTAADVPSGGTWPYNNPFFLITNMAVGGSLGGTPDSGTAAAGQTMLDFVHYYQSATVPGPAITPAAAITVSAGAAGSTTVDFASASGSGLAYLTCTNAPAKATCSIDTATPLNSHVLDFRSNSSAQATVHVTTTANTATNFAPAYSAWATLFGAFVLLPAFPQRLWMRRLGLIIGVLVVLISAAAFQSCGGGSSPSTNSGGGGGGAANGTPAGHYTLTITAYTVSGDTSTANLTLNVN